MFEEMSKAFELKDVNVAEYSPLTLAYIGDCVYELIIRTNLVYQANAPVNKLNQKASKMAKAQTQAIMIDGIMEHLTAEEEAAYRRGRNAHSYTKAKNATTGEYRKATGFEALCGFLFLSNNTARVTEIVKKAIELAEIEL